MYIFQYLELLIPKDCRGTHKMDYEFKEGDVLDRETYKEVFFNGKKFRVETPDECFWGVLFNNRDCKSYSDNSIGNTFLFMAANTTSDSKQKAGTVYRATIGENHFLNIHKIPEKYKK